MRTLFQNIQKKTRQKLQLIVLSMLVAGSVHPQLPLEFSVEVMAPFPLRYQTWLTEASTYLIPVTNKTDESYDFFLRASIQGVGPNNGDITINVREDFLPANTLHIGPLQSLVFSGQEIGDSYGNVELSDFDISPAVDQGINGELPEGEYEICFEILFYNDVDPSDNYFLGPTTCSEPFLATHGDLEIITPFNGQVVTEDDMPLYCSWMMNSTYFDDFNLEYQLKLYHLPDGLDESVEELILSGAYPPFFTTDPSLDLFHVHDVDLGFPEFVDGGHYAAIVELVSGGSELFTQNNKKSNIHLFQYYTELPDGGGNGDDGSNEYVDCEDRCEPDLPENTNLISDFSSLSEFQIGNFTVEDVNISTNSGDKIFGEGTVTIDFLNNLKLNVLFTGVEINTDGIAIDGDINAMPAFEHTTLLETIGNTLASDGVIDPATITSVLEAVDNISAIQDFANGEAVNLPFGINQSFDGSQFMFAVTDFNLTPTSSDIDFLNILNFPNLGAGTAVAMGASDVCLAPEGFGREYTIHLAADTSIPFDGDIEMILSGGSIIEGAQYDGSTNQEPTRLAIDCNGFKSLHIAGKLFFPEDMLKKEGPDGTIIEGERAVAYFNADLEKIPGEDDVYDIETLEPTGTHFIAEASMEAFQIAGLDGYGFEIQEAVLDLSQLENSSSFELPEGYVFSEDQLELWEGLFIHDLIVRPPSDLSVDERPSSQAGIIMIDNTLSFDIFAENLLTLEQGNFNGWAMALDTLSFKMTQNVLNHGHLYGKFSAPVFDSEEHLRYVALVDEKSHEEIEGNYYTFNGIVEPNQDIGIPFAIGQANLCGNSYLAFQTSPIPAEKQSELFLKGGLDMNTGNYGEALLGNASLNLADFQLQYNTVQGFVLPEDSEDLGGTYFGSQGFDAQDCDLLEPLSGEAIFYRLINEYLEEGDDVFGNYITEEGDEDEENTNENDYLTGNEMNGLPIRFNSSQIEINAGIPTLSISVEMDLGDNEFAIGGLNITGKKIDDGPKFNIGVEGIDFFANSGSIVMNTPVEGSQLAEDEAIPCKWTVDISDEDLVERLEFELTLIEIPLETASEDVEAVFEGYSGDPFFTISELENSEYNIPLTAPATAFVFGNRYAVRVQATDPDGEELINEGYSNIKTFIFGQTEQDGPDAGNNSACAERCSPSLPTNTTPHANQSSATSFSIGNFLVEEVSVEQESGGKISGEGEVTLDFVNNVKVRVTFTDVILNSDFAAIEGNVVGKDETGGTLLADVANYIAGSGTATGQVVQTLKETVEVGRMVGQIATGSSIGLPFGINTNMGGDNVVMAFTDIKLTPTSTDVDFINILSFPSLGENFCFGIGASDICIAPDGFGNEAKLSLIEDLTIPIDGDVEIIIKGGLVSGDTDEVDTPSYLEISCNGFQSFRLAGEVVFPQSMLVKDDNGSIDMTENVKAYFATTMERQPDEDAYSTNNTEAGTHLLTGLTMDPFQIQGLEGWSFEVISGALDLSELENDPALVFPDSYDFSDISGGQELWKGFYLNRLTVSPPGEFNENGDRASTEIQHLLIDPQLSADFVAEQLLNYEDGSIKGWGMSIDEFRLSIVQNTFIEGSLSGQFGAPIMDEADFLDYAAAISRQDENDDSSPYIFNAVVNPPEDGYTIGVPMIAAANANVCGSSYLGLQISPEDDETHLELFIKGNAGVDLGGFLGSEEGDFKIAALEYQLKYNTVKGFVLEQDVTDGTGSTFGVGLAVADACDGTYMPNFQELVDEFQSSGGSGIDRDISIGAEDRETDDSEITSEENIMNGFPIRFGDFGFGLSNGLPEVSFNVDLALSSGGQGLVAGAGLTLVTKKTDNGGKFNIGLDRVEFNCARLAADLDMMLLVACLCHENDNGVNGYFGQVIVDVENTLTVDLKGGYATMGTRDDGAFGTAGYYGMWYVDGKVTLEQGIPLGPITLNGLGGGIYWNMDAPPLPGQDDIMAATTGGEEPLTAVADCMLSLAEDIELPNSVLTDLNAGSPTPHHGVRTIKFNTSLSIIRPELLIIDPLVEVSWTENEGINQISVGGYLYLLQGGHDSRGAPSTPSDAGDLGAIAAASGAGSRLWASSFNTLHVHRTGDEDLGTANTLFAFEGVGSVYLNLVENMLYGSQDPNDDFKLITKDIFIGHQDHPRTNDLGFASSGDGSTYWHAYFGDPYAGTPGSVTFDLMGAITGNASSNDGLNVTATTYFMIGQGIPTYLPDVPQEITDIIGRASSGTEDGEGSFDGPAIDANAERTGSTTSGMAFGAGVSLGLGIDKVIYANLNVMLGFDLLLIDTEGMSCNANGNTYSPPGIEGWYGMGQVYAGLEGGLGVRGKILGKEIDVKFLELGAAMMLTMGGPNPFWFDGKAGVYYSVLGGLIKGNANIEVSAGEACYPYDADPFALNAIDQIYPTLDMTGEDAASPYAKPTVTFKMKVADKGSPHLSSMTLPIVSEDDPKATVNISPVLEEFTIKDEDGVEVSGSWEIASNKRSVKFTPDYILAGTDQETENREWELYVNVRSMVYLNGRYEYVPNFNDDSLVVFQTTPLDPYIEYVTHTNPIRGQQFFMSDEWQGNGQNNGLIKFYANESQNRFYVEDDQENSCDYEIIFKNMDTDQEIYRHNLGITESYDQDYLDFPLPDLDADTEYVMQLVRKKSGQRFEGIDLGFQRIQKSTISADIFNAYGVSNNYSIEYESEPIDPFLDVNANETLMHMIAFKTSKFDLLEDKLNAVSAYYDQGGTVCGNYCVAYDQLTFKNLDETFEEIELLGYEQKIKIPYETAEYFFTDPRVFIMDPLDGNFYEDLVKPLANDYIGSIRTFIDDKEVGLWMIDPGIGTDIDNDLLDQPEMLGIGGGPSADYDYLWSALDDEDSVYKLQFNPYSYSLINRDNYSDPYEGLFFAEDRLRVENVLNESDLKKPMSQEGTEDYFSDFGLQGLGNAGTTTKSKGDYVLEAFVGTKDITLKYESREMVEEQISDMIDWGEEKIQLIQDPQYDWIEQRWSDYEVNMQLMSPIAAHNAILASALYTGNASDLEWLSSGSSGGTSSSSSSSSSSGGITGIVSGGKNTGMISSGTYGSYTTGTGNSGNTGKTSMTSTNLTSSTMTSTTMTSNVNGGSIYNWLSNFKSSYIEAIYNVREVDASNGVIFSGSKKTFTLKD